MKAGVSPPAEATELPAVRGWLEERIEERALFTGAQVSVVRGGAVVADVAVGTDGEGRPVTPAMQFRVYCAAKPMLATVLCLAAQRGRLDRRAPLGSLQPDVDPVLGEVRVDDLLHHQTPLAQPTGFGSAFLPAGTRTKTVQRQSALAIRGRSGPAYGEVAGWLLLSEALTSATGRSWTALLHEHAEAVGLPADEVSVDSDELAAHHRAGRVGVNVSLRGGRMLPMLGEVAPSLGARLDGPGFGPACSTRFLTRLVHDAVVRRGLGAVSRRRVVAGDPVYGRDLAFSDGFMVGPDTLGISDLWPADVAGHTGIAGMTLVFASPSLDLAVGVHLNGMLSPADGAAFVRPALTALLYSEVVAASG